MAGAHRLGEPVDVAAKRMRPAAPIVSAAVLVLLAAIVFAGGRNLPREPAGAATPLRVETIPAAPALSADPPPVPRRSPVASRLVAPKIVAPPDLDPHELEWTAPRAPLGELGLALPPKPEMPDDWDGATLFRPVAVESAVVEAMGRKVAIAGTSSVAADETCDFDGVPWACGIRARTAFRLWLRGRALICALPPYAERAAIAAPCRLGKQDAGAWLVSNGWARAAPGGPYAEAQKSAETARKGIFGPPPDLSGFAPVPVFETFTPPADQPVLSE